MNDRVKKIVERYYSDDKPESNFFMVIAYLGQKKPQPPVWVRATGVLDARDQFMELINYKTTTQSPHGDDIRLYIYDESIVAPEHTRTDDLRRILR